MTWSNLAGFSTFEKARRKELAKRLTRLVRGRDADDLLSLDDVRQRLKLYEQWYAGIKSIPVAKIAGSVDRAADFDRGFLPKRRGIEERWKRVERVFESQAFPPIVVFKVGDAFFVEDGHHRVGIARQRKAEFIDAEVTEVNSPVPISSSTSAADVIHMGLRGWFMRESGLEGMRPEAEIEPSRPHAYGDLLEIVQARAFDLMIERETLLTPGVAANHWYEGTYLPAVRSIRSGNLPTFLPRATDTDLYLRVHSQLHELIPVRATSSIEDAVSSAVSTEATKLKSKARLAVEDAKEILRTTGTATNQDQPSGDESS